MTKAVGLSPMSETCLVTTALEETWDAKRHNIFLGEWALLYGRRQAWQALPGELCAPFGTDPDERLAQFVRIQQLAAILLDELVLALNKVHGKCHDRRFWNILLGHWLQRFLSMLFNRHGSLKQALQQHTPFCTHVLDSAGFEPSTRDSGSFVVATNEPHWNHFLYARLLRDISSIALLPIEGWQAPQLVASSRPASPLRCLAQEVLDGASARLTRSTDALILNSYLPRHHQTKLFLSLGQFPQKWKPRPLPDWAVNHGRRAALRQELGSADDEFERLARAYLADYLPRCFLEGYGDLQAMAASLPWPSRPRFIFTSNNFDSDELFKVWTAGKVTAGTPYFVGQHGAGYGTHHYFQTRYAPEHAASDCFLTWGWSNEDPRNVPAYLLKTAGMKPPPLAAGASRLLLVAPVVPNQVTHWDSVHEFGCNQQFQFRMVQALPGEIRSQVLVRLHHGAAQKTWQDVQRWKDAVPDVPVDNGVVPLEKQLDQVRLALFAYDSTGMLEFFALDRPAMSMWYGGLDHLLPEARDAYQQLIEAGLVHLDPESAATCIAKHWVDIRSWWDGAQVKAARENFCRRYARQSHQPVRELRKLLLAACTAREV
jgi:putative transferase (TIGR04331 family)